MADEKQPTLDQPKAESEPMPAPPKIATPEGLFAISREEILRADDIKQEWVEVPEWSTDGKRAAVLVRGLDGVHRDAYDKSNRTPADNKLIWINMRARLVQRCVIDPVDGNFQFQEADVVALGQKSGAALNRVWSVAARLSGMTDDEKEKIAENLDQTGSGDSVSD